MRSIIKTTFCFISIIISCQVSAENTCKDTTLWFGEKPYVMPTKEETSQALLLYKQSKKLLIAGKKAQKQHCLKKIKSLISGKEPISKQADKLHSDFFGISASAGHLQNCLACGSSSLQSCKLGLNQLKEDEQYLNCINDTYYHLPK